MAIKNKKNLVKLQGRVYDSTLAYKTSKKGVDYIGGRLSIATDEKGLNIIPVEYGYVTPTITRKEQTVNNPAYAVLDKIISEKQTWLEVGKDNALKVEISAQMGINDWYPNSDDEDSLVSTPRVESGFGGGRIKVVSELPEAKPEGWTRVDDRNDFQADVVITNATLTEESDTNSEEFLTLRCGAFTWQDELLPFNVVVRNPAGIKYFLDEEISNKHPLYTGIRVKLNFTTQKVTRVTEAAFGEDVVDSYERSTKEWTLITCNKVPYEYEHDASLAEDDKIMTSEDLKKAMQNRNTHLAEVLARAKENTKKASQPSAPVAKQDDDFSF